MKKIYLITLLFSTSYLSYGQDFSFQMYFEDAAGNRDTITLGYDDNGTDEIDASFGETNIILEPINSGLDVRISDEWYKRKFDNVPGTFHTKKQIVEKKCDQWFSIPAIDFHTENWPVTASWDSTLFVPDCRIGTVFTAAEPGGWFDVWSFGSNFNNKFLKNANQITFTSNYNNATGQGIYYENDNNDTIPVFFQAFGGYGLLTTGVEDQFLSADLKLFPNPTTGELTIFLEEGSPAIQDIHVFDLLGSQQSIYWKNEQVSIGNLAAGIYFIHIQLTDKSSLTQKIIKE